MPLNRLKIALKWIYQSNLTDLFREITDLGKKNKKIKKKF
jgi:hypothetical protein